MYLCLLLSAGRLHCRFFRRPVSIYTRLQCRPARVPRSIVVES
jgi:hypothetical protein